MFRAAATAGRLASKISSAAQMIFPTAHPPVSTASRRPAARRRGYTVNSANSTASQPYTRRSDSNKSSGSVLRARPRRRPERGAQLRDGRRRLQIFLSDQFVAQNGLSTSQPSGKSASGPSAASGSTATRCKSGDNFAGQAKYFLAAIVGREAARPAPPPHRRAGHKRDEPAAPARTSNRCGEKAHGVRGCPLDTAWLQVGQFLVGLRFAPFPSLEIPSSTG